MVFPWKEKCCPSNGSNRNKSDSKQKSIVKTDATMDGNSSCKIINNENWFFEFFYFYSFHTDCILLVRNTITSLIMTHNIVRSQNGCFWGCVWYKKTLWKRSVWIYCLRSIWGHVWSRDSAQFSNCCFWCSRLHSCGELKIKLNDGLYIHWSLNFWDCYGRFTFKVRWVRADPLPLISKCY